MLLNLIHGPQHTTERLDILLPAVHKCVGQMHVSPYFPVLIKTHFLLSPLMPLFGNTARFMYIVRNPLDTMMSNLNYMYTAHGIDRDTAYGEGFKREYIERFIASGGDSSWIRLGRGSWIEHVRSWLGNEPGFPNLVLRYEDLLADPAAQLRRINDFLGLRKSSSEIRAAIGHSTFDQMKRIEEEELANGRPGFFMSENYEKSIRLGNRFMNLGKVGSGKKELTHDQRERFRENFGATMELLGYRLNQRGGVVISCSMAAHASVRPARVGRRALTSGLHPDEAHPECRAL